MNDLTSEGLGLGRNGPPCRPRHSETTLEVTKPRKTMAGRLTRSLKILFHHPRLITTFPRPRDAAADPEGVTTTKRCAAREQHQARSSKIDSHMLHAGAQSQISRAAKSSLEKPRHFHQWTRSNLCPEEKRYISQKVCSESYSIQSMHAQSQCRLGGQAQYMQVLQPN